jgi:hypothetical protein
MSQTIEEVTRERDDALRIIANPQTRCDTAEKRAAELEEYATAKARVNDRLNEELETAKKGVTRWFTFGQDHTHRYGETTLDRDIVVQITDPNPRAVMFAHFGRKWSCEYDELPDMGKYPRGVFVL